MSSKSKEPNMFVFATIICVVCSVILTAAATGLKDRQDENMKLDKQKNILLAMGYIGFGQKVSKEEVKTLYSENVYDQWVDDTGIVYENNPNGSFHPIYISMENGLVEKYALPTAGYGLWSWVYGYVAFEGDGETIAGMSVYKHGETPGLGGECEKPWFLKQFIGKKITDDNGEFISVAIVKGKVKDLLPESKWGNNVDGISGATITSKGLSDSLKDNLQVYEAFAKRLR